MSRSIGRKPPFRQTRDCSREKRCGRWVSKATVIVADQRDVGRVVEELQGHGYQAIGAPAEMQAVPGVIALVRLVSSVVTGGLLVICGITSAMFMVSLVRRRSREFGILPARLQVGRARRGPPASWIAEMVVVLAGRVLERRSDCWVGTPGPAGSRPQ